MSIHFQINVDGEDAERAIAELRTVFGALSAPVGVVGAVVTGPNEPNAEVKTGEVIPPKKTRKSKADKEPENTAPLADASSAEKTESASMSSTAEISDTSASNASSGDVPDLDEVRTKLKKYKAHLFQIAVAGGADTEEATEQSDAAMFKFLARFGARNASTIPELKRADVIAASEAAIAGGEDPYDIPTIQDVQAKIKKLGATDGLGHDKVFELLGKYGAKNSATVPEDKRAALIAEIDELLAGAK